MVASTVAAQGLDVVSGEHLLVASGNNEMVAAIELLLRDSNRWQTISANARALVRSHYLAEIAYRPLDEALARVSARA